MITHGQFSVVSFVQYNSLEERLGTNVRLRYNFREGHDLFLVYNNQTQVNQSEEDTNYQTNNSNVLTFKYPIS